MKNSILQIVIKKIANEEVYKDILQLFQKEMNKEEFLQRYEKKFGKGSTNVCWLVQKRLQAKYNAIKRKWPKIKYRQRKGSRLDPKSNPEWYEKIDYILGDTY